MRDYTIKFQDGENKYVVYVIRKLFWKRIVGAIRIGDKSKSEHDISLSAEFCTATFQDEFWAWRCRQKQKLRKLKRYLIKERRY